MKKHLLLTVLAYAYFGFGWAVEMFGIKAGLSLATALTIFISSMVFYLIIVLTSLQKLKDFISPPNIKTDQQ